MCAMKIFKWNAEKNEILEKERRITFEEIVEMIESGAYTLEVDHPNKKKYPNQRLLIVDASGYAYMLPFVKDGEAYFLKTIIPSRKATKRYLGGQNDET
jgi:uncharacterized DUF497 family protein